MLLKPNPLKPGATIGVVSPARHAPDEWMEKCQAGLEGMGFKVVVHAQNSARHHQLAGDDEARAKAIMDYFAGPAIDAIFCARGGIGSYRLLDLLDYDLIKKNPKIFCGFSDITTLLTAFYVKCGLVGFHAPMGWNFIDPDPALPPNLKDNLMGQLLGVEQVFPLARPLREGKAEGRLLGGNLCLLQNLIGTTYDLDTGGAILFIEDTEERWSAFDRTLHHMALAGKFKNIKALIVGELVDMREEDGALWGDDYRDALKKLVPAGIPIVTNFPCGHGKNMATLPIGIAAGLEIGPKTTVLKLLESPFA
jgi:muramoyltetrapeptide carboxypeptidase